MIDSVRCEDLYSDLIKEDASGQFSELWQTEDESVWICPDLKQFEFKDYTYLTMQVTACSDAGAQPYASSECDESGIV